MFGNKKTETRGRKSLSKKQTILNVLRGQSITWKTLNTKFGLKSQEGMVDTLRAEGYMIYGSKVKKVNTCTNWYTNESNYLSRYQSVIRYLLNTTMLQL